MSEGRNDINDGSGAPEPFFSGRVDHPTVPYDGANLGPGSQIGSFKLLGILGEGGYGLVYLAEQERPLRRRVALKVIKPGMDSKQVIARFEAERQALALLDHPNIAHVYDAGTTQAGRPYFAMEHVEGVPITRFCDKEKLPIKERLSLFLQVCNAIQHAHQKGIIHRDLKPSNILVTAKDGQPLVKVIDFGVAKALSQSLTEKTLYTEQGQFIGTPDYMSPEQAEMDPQGIDTRSDVYSLGVVLYEMLTGVLPFDPEELRSGGIGHIRTVIREHEPRTPSTRLTDMGDEARQIAERRQTDPRTLVRSLHRELEWIPLKAMRKEPSRRYQSVSELASDIENYLKGAPLLAGPESVTYRLRKFLQRHRGAVAAALALLVTLAVGLIVSTALYVRAEGLRVVAEDARQKAVTAGVAEQEQRRLAEAESQRAKEAEQNAVRRLATSYEQEARGHMVSGRWAEALVYLSEAYSIEKDRASLRFLIAEATRAYDQAGSGRMGGTIPWRVGDRNIECLDYAMSSDRSRVAILDKERGTVHVFSATTGMLEASLPGEQHMERLAFAPDGHHIIMLSEPNEGGMTTLRIVNISTRKTELEKTSPGPKLQLSRVLTWLDTQYNISRPGIEKTYTSLCVNRQGTWLAIPEIDLDTCDTTILLWDIAGGHLYNMPRTIKGPVYRMAFPSGDRLFTEEVTQAKDGGNAWLWDAKTGECLGSGWGLGSIDFCVLASTTSDLEKIVWIDSPNVYLYHKTTMVSTWMNSVAAGFSPDGSRFITRQDGPLQMFSMPGSLPGVIWDATSGKPIAGLPGPELVKWHFTPDSRRLVTEHVDGQVRVWDSANGASISTVPAARGQALADISPDGRWLITRSGETQRSTKIWALETGEGFQLADKESEERDLSAGWFSFCQDRIFRFSNKSPLELPRFNVDGSKMLTPTGLRELDFEKRSPQEVQRWVRAYIPLRLGEQGLRHAGQEEMLTARLEYVTSTKGVEASETVRARLEVAGFNITRHLDAGELEQALALADGLRSWVPAGDAELLRQSEGTVQRVSQAYYLRARTRDRTGKYEEAIQDCGVSLRVYPENLQALEMLAWLQSTCTDLKLRDAKAAVRNATRACELTAWQDWQHLATLAVASAAAGDFAHAVEYQKKSLQMLPESDRKKWVANLQRRLTLYTAGEPYDWKKFLDLPTRDLVAWWKLDEGQGLIATDSSGNDHNGIITGDVHWEPGLLGSALRFGGEQGYVDCGNDSAFDLADALSVTAWIKSDAFRSRSAHIISKGSWTWCLGAQGETDKVLFDVDLRDTEGSSHSRIVRGVDKTDDNRWHHVVGVYDSDSARLYVDGILRASRTAPGTVKHNAWPVFLGTNSEIVRYRQYNGLIDEVRVYDRALDANEVAQLYYHRGDNNDNCAPIAEAGSMQSLTWPDNTLQLSARVIDDGRPGGADALTVHWSLLNGPDSVKFSPSGDVTNPQALFSQPGVYELQVVADDGELQGSDFVAVVVYPKGFDGLIAHYSFDDGTARNTALAGFPDTRLVGRSAIVSADQRGYVLDAGGHGAYLDCGSDLRLNFTKEITLAASVKIPEMGGRKARIVGKTGPGWQLSFWGDTGIVDFVCPGVYVPSPEYNDIRSTRSIIDGRWHHVVGVFDGKAMHLYLDGSLNATVPGDGLINVSEGRLVIGDDSEGVGPDWHYQVDNICVYNRALTPEQVANLYQSTK